MVIQKENRQGWRRFFCEYMGSFGRMAVCTAYKAAPPVNGGAALHCGPIVVKV